MPEARGKTEVVDSGVDLERFRDVRARGGARVAGVPARRLADRAQERRAARRRVRARSDAGRSPSSATARCAARSKGATGVRVVGRVPHDEVPGWLAAADVVCGPACRAVRAGAARGDGLRPHRRRDARRRPARVRRRTRPASSSTRSTRPSSRARSRRRPPCRRRTRRPAAPRRSTTSGGRRSGWRRSSCEPFEIGQPDLDERPRRPPRGRARGRARAPARSSAGSSRPRRPV